MRVPVWFRLVVVGSGGWSGCVVVSAGMAGVVSVCSVVTAFLESGLADLVVVGLGRVCCWGWFWSPVLGRVWCGRRC